MILKLRDDYKAKIKSFYFRTSMTRSSLGSLPLPLIRSDVGDAEPCFSDPDPDPDPDPGPDLEIFAGIVAVSKETFMRIPMPMMYGRSDRPFSSAGHPCGAGRRLCFARQSNQPGDPDTWRAP